MAVTTAAVVGIAGTVGTAIMSYNQAENAQDAADKAALAAEEDMKRATGRAEIDYYEALTIPIDAYEAAFESTLATDQTSIEALQEGDSRGLAAGVGRVGALSAQRGEATRIAMGQQLSKLERDKLDSKDAINQQLIEMDVSNVREQNMRLRDAEILKANAQRQMIQSVTQGVDSIASVAPLYSKNKQDREFNRFYKGLDGIGHEGVSEADISAYYRTLGDDTKDIFNNNENKFSFDKNTLNVTGPYGNQIYSNTIPSLSGYQYLDPSTGKPVKIQ